MCRDSHILSIIDQRFVSTLGRHKAFWERAEEDSFLRSVGLFAPSTPVTVLQPDGRAVAQAGCLEPDMIDPTTLIDEAQAWDASRFGVSPGAEAQFLVLVGLGDLLPHSWPHPKIPWIEAMLGCPVKMTAGQIWSERYEGDPEEIISRGSNFEHNPWFQLYLEFLRQLQDRLGGGYPVSVNTLLRGTSDLAAAVMGVGEACMGWIDRPAFMARLMRVCTDAVLAVAEAGYKIIQPFAGGYLSGWAIWAPEPVFDTQADHSTLLSHKMYERQILPYDLEVIRCCPISTFHIHNNGFHIAPLLVQIAELDAIQVWLDPYPDVERKPYELETLRMIQNHKPLILHANFPNLKEADSLLAELSPRGLCFNALFDSATFASLPAGLPGSEVWFLGQVGPEN
jgi:hypothetical protein